MNNLKFALIHRMDILFWFRKADYQPAQIPKGHPKDDDFGTIHCRITINAKRVAVGATPVRCWRSQWRNGRVHTGKTLTNTALMDNMRLDQMRTNLQQIHMGLVAEGKTVSGYLVKELYFRTIIEGKPSVVTAIELMDAWLLYEQRRVDSGILSKDSLDIRKRHLSHLRKYLMTGRRSALPAEEFSDNIMDEFRLWLLGAEKKHPGYVYKILQSVKSVFIWGSGKKKLIAQNPLQSYSIPADPTEPDTTHLSSEQVVKLVHFNFHDLVGKTILRETADALDRERDSFLFCCFTGLHDEDYKERNYQIEKNDLGYWLVGRRGKTKTKFELPVDPFAVKIIEKYGTLQDLPKTANQTRNDRLKQLAVIAGLDIHLTTKVARKTFTDRMLNVMGYDPLDVASMLGHKSLRNLKHYVRIKQERLANKFIRLDIEKT